MIAVDDGRRRHYGVFYGLEPAPSGAGLVLGNCQAESLRLVIDGVAGPTVRIPPVFELEPDDLSRLDRILESAEFVVLQPVRDDYRGLPLGTAQIRARLAPTCRVALVTPVRYFGLHPAWTPLHLPGFDESPPIVAYHDVRTLGRVAGLPLPDRLPAEAVRAFGAASVAELQRRAASVDAVPVADLLEHPTFDLVRTPNHPADPVFDALGRRILEALGVRGDPVDPGHPLLDSVEAPRDDWVIDAWGLPDPPRPSWLVDGREVAADEITAAHEAWYRSHPGFVRGAMRRLEPLLSRWRAT